MSLIARPVMLVAAALAVAATSIGVYLKRSAGGPNLVRSSRLHSPKGAGYAFRVRSDFALVEYRQPSRPEGSPVSVFQNPDDIRIAVTWNGLAALARPVSRATLPAAGRSIERVLHAEQREEAARVRRKLGHYRGRISQPRWVIVAGLPAQRYGTAATAADGSETVGETDVIFKLQRRTPLILSCSWPAGRNLDAEARVACRNTRRSLEIREPPLTG